MKKNKIYLIIFCIIVLLSTSVYGSSYELPEPSYDFYVYDEAGIIDKDIENYIIDINKDIYKKTGAQIVVSTVNSLGDMDINSYATALFEKWEIGSKEYDNGMLVLIVPNDREIWIEVGYGLEGRFPDSKTKRIIDNYILPYFAEEKYSDGVLAGFNQILIGLEEEYNISLDKSKVVDEPFPVADLESSISKIPIIIGIIIFLFIDFKLFRGMITYSILRGIGRGGRGGGFGGSSGGGRSSGGGGRSGGGGAGGKW
ncbi:TPM domain-containing protein [Tissierella sp.]|uniref:TPM domain-containing protein n=1 Tax=Tissierella sp. TaxID=41274 RepID=UPI00305A4A6D